MLLSRSIAEWQAGLDKFIDTIFEENYTSETTTCPCLRCRGVVYKTKSEVQMHLVTKGFDENFVKEKVNDPPAMMIGMQMKVWQMMHHLVTIWCPH